MGNGRLAVDEAEKGCHDVILMDLGMPIMDGLSATKAIRQLPAPAAAAIPIHALTADVLTKSSGSLEDMGLDGYLTKPIEWEKVLAVLRAVMEGRGRSNGGGGPGLL